MKKCVIMPDSFKHTMSSIEICDIIATQVLRFFPDCQTVQIPVADGGEGTTDCFLFAGGAEKVQLTVHGPYGQPLGVYYARIGDTAVIEMAQAAGLPLVEDRPDPAATSTYGVGEIARHAIENGCSTIVIGLGGSSTNDAGAGFAAALGVRFYDQAGRSFVPTGGTLGLVSRIDKREAAGLLTGRSIIAMCDVDNPMFGPEGAAHIYAPQKGADQQMVQELDNNLRHLSEVIRLELGLDVSQLPGAGAAGAMGAGIVAFLGGRLQSGIQTVLDLVGFDRIIEDADLIITGEGKIDGQSLRGKVVIGIAERAMKKAIPVVVVAGDIGRGAEQAYNLGVSAIFSTNRLAVPFTEARKTSRDDLAATIESIMRLWQIST